MRIYKSCPHSFNSPKKASLLYSDNFNGISYRKLIDACIVDETITDGQFTDSELACFSASGCVFRDSKFTDIDFRGCYFYDCKFINCEFIRSKMGAVFIRCEFDSTKIDVSCYCKDIRFKESYINASDLWVDGFDSREILFWSCDILDSKISSCSGFLTAGTHLNKTCKLRMTRDAHGFSNIDSVLGLALMGLTDEEGLKIESFVKKEFKDKIWE